MKRPRPKAGEVSQPRLAPRRLDQVQEAQRLEMRGHHRDQVQEELRDGRNRVVGFRKSKR